MFNTGLPFRRRIEYTTATVPYLKIQDHVIFYTRQGRGVNPALFLIHGAGGNHLTWPEEIRRLPNTVVYSLDLPGHGRSPGEPKYRISDYAEVVIQALSELDLDKVVLAGYSMGGAIALEIGLRKLPIVTGLVLLSTGARLRVAEHFLKLLATDFQEASRQLANQYWSPGIPLYKLEGSKRMLLETGPEATLADFTACNNFDRLNDCADLKTPTLIVSGGLDQLTPPKYSRFLSTQLKNSILVEVPGTAHLAFLEKPLLVSEAISSFLGELR